MKNKNKYSLYFFTIFTLLVSSIYAQTITNISTSASACPGSIVLVSFDTAGFTGTINFQVILSNENGQFGLPPTSIGAGTSSPISCLIPANAIPSANYLINVGSTAPPVLGTSPFLFQVNAPIASFTSTITSSSLTICPNTNVDFTSTLNPPIAGATYTWYIGSTIVVGANTATLSTSTINADTTVYCEVIVPSECVLDTTATSNILSISVSNNAIPFVVNATASPSTPCVGTTVTLTSTIVSGSGNLTYNWSYINANDPPFPLGNTSTITTNTIPAGAIVILTVTSDAACLSPNPISVNVNLTVSPFSATPPKITIKQDVTFCGDPNDVGIFSVSPILENAEYLWFVNGSQLPTETVPTTLHVAISNLIAGQKISCKIISSNPCILNPVGVSNEITVETLTKPEIKISEDFTMNFGEKDKHVDVSGDIQIQSIKWSPSTSNLIVNPFSVSPIVTPPKTQKYTVDAIALNGCKVSGEVTVTVTPDKFLFLPDIFSPNNDGKNDVFYCRNNPGQINPSTFLMRIFDENGTMVFESNYQNYGWDGNYRNQPCSQATYFYYVYGVYFNSEEIEQNGKLLLIR